MIRLDFAISPRPECDHYVRGQLRTIINTLVTGLSDHRIISIILTGGITRGETAAICTDEQVEVFSDYDFLVLFEDIQPEVLRKIQRISATLTERLSREGLPVHVDIHPVTPRILSRMRPLMFTLELKETAVSVYGEDHRAYMPRLSPFDIPRDDSLRMLHNRIAGSLEYFRPLHLRSRGMEITQLKFFIYHLCKNFIDMASSLLSFNGLYVCGYGQRAQLFREHFAEFAHLQTVPDLPEVVRTWTDFRSNPDVFQLAARRGYDGSPAGLSAMAMEIWIEQVHYMEAVWRYEAALMFGGEGLDTDALVNLYVRKNSFLSHRLVSAYDSIMRARWILPKTLELMKALHGCNLSSRIYALALLLFFRSTQVFSEGIPMNIRRLAPYAKHLDIELFIGADAEEVWEVNRQRVTSLWREKLS